MLVTTTKYVLVTYEEPYEFDSITPDTTTPDLGLAYLYSDRDMAECSRKLKDNPDTFMVMEVDVTFEM